MAAKVALKLQGPVNGIFYTECDPVRGTVELTVDKALDLRRLTVSLRGVSQTRSAVGPEGAYTVHPSNPNAVVCDGESSSHVVYSQSIQLFPSANVSNCVGETQPFTIAKDTYSYDFAFKMVGGPECLRARRCQGGTFLKDMANERHQHHLPPSFNDKGGGQTVRQIELFYYALGRVRYMIKAELELDTSRRWFASPSSSSTVKSTEVVPFMPAQCIQLPCDEPGALSLDSSPKLRPEPNGGWLRLDVRSRGFGHVHRMDYLFREDAGKIAGVSLVTGGSDWFERHVSAERLLLYLNEEVVYFANKRSNRNSSQLLLMDTMLDQHVDLSEARETGNREREMELKLASNKDLRRLRFNEEDYIHRGNKLFSFTTCNIRREYHFRLVVHWNIDGYPVKSEVVIKPVTVYSGLALPPGSGHPPPAYEV